MTHLSSGLKNVSASAAKSASSAFALGYHFHRSNCTAWEWSIHTEKPLRVMCKEKEIPAAGTFVITAETIDPFHIILDMF